MTGHSTYYCDFHIHIGRSQGKPVKMAAAPSLTLNRLLDYARDEKGLDLITVIDGVCRGVQEEIRDMIQAGSLRLQEGGGYQYKNGLSVLLGAEVEIGGPSGGAAHFGCWFPTIDAASEFEQFLRTVQKNTWLSSQKAHIDAVALQTEVYAHGGLFVVHHAFTPHKGIYGNCVTNLKDMVDPKRVDAVELGLSADTDMADCLTELSAFTFLSNSDAHSLGKVAREYNALRLQKPTFDEVKLALHHSNGRQVECNYGLQPLLGKYHRTYCKDCGLLWDELASNCTCGSVRRVPGVYDRLIEVRDVEEPRHPSHRPPYVHQIPLEFIPGLGPKLRGKLFQAFGTEMNILHHVTKAELTEVVGEKLAGLIDESRRGNAAIESGGGGTYGKLRVN